jgi:transposase InsO family protein
VLTDNDHCYRDHRFQRTLGQFPLKHHFTEGYRPQTNGKVERFIQTGLRERVTPAPTKTHPNSNTNLTLEPARQPIRLESE